MSARDVQERYRRVLDRGAELADLTSAEALLGWDQETKMPKKGVEGRSRVSATLAGLSHDKMTDPRLREDLEALSGNGGGLDPDARALVKEFLRLADRAARVPGDLVREMAELESVAAARWAEAREAKDFDRFAPFLERVVALKRRQAEALGYEDEPYDALLENFEPGVLTLDAARTLNALRDFLVPVVRRIVDQEGPDASLLAGPYDAALQDLFGREVIAAMGFDMEAGRLDLSAHPFTSGIHLGDVRLTTRYKDDLSVGLFGTIHEAGHGLYEQNLPADHRRDPLGQATSLGLHESQSRLWENMVGRGRPFWTHFYGRLRALFPDRLGNVPLEAFYRAVNVVRPSFVRIEADEVTYNLHIIVRFELERAILSGDVEARDLPEAWNAKVREYLGIVPPTPDLGVLQDIHWSMGLVGYFPTYTLGNLYGAQLFEAALRDVPDLEDRIARGDLLTLRDWLVENVHRWGRRHRAVEVVERVSGKPFTIDAFSSYVKRKYGEIYDLS